MKQYDLNNYLSKRKTITFIIRLQSIKILSLTENTYIYVTMDHKILLIIVVNVRKSEVNTTTSIN